MSEKNEIENQFDIETDRILEVAKNLNFGIVRYEFGTVIRLDTWTVPENEQYYEQEVQKQDDVEVNVSVPKVRTIDVEAYSRLCLSSSGFMNLQLCKVEDDSVLFVSDNIPDIVALQSVSEGIDFKDKTNLNKLLKGL